MTKIEQAKQMDLLTYLQTYEPHELVCISPRVYSTRSHDSLKISNGKWFRWSSGVGGVSALDFLIKVRGMEFADAVNHLCGKMQLLPPISYTATPPPKPPFRLPKPYINNDRVIAYLKRRGIGGELIKYCIDHALLYEDERNNCCFVGYYGLIPKYAMLRSSNPNSTFMREVEGSNKAYSFKLPVQQDCETLYIFEGCIDCLSFIELYGRNGNYLSLGGVAQNSNLPVALVQFLRDNPHINHVNICLDSDAVGRTAAKSIEQNLPKSITSTILLPDKFKDYSAQLQASKGIRYHVKMRNSKEELSR